MPFLVPKTAALLTRAPVVVVPPPTSGISFIGFASAAATTVTLPGGYQTGDVALPFAFRSTAATVPTLGTGAVLISSGAANTCAQVWGFRALLASTGLTSGTFTGATQLMYPIYRGAKGFAARSANAASSASMNYAAVTAGAASNAWWVAGGAHRTATNVNGAVSGLTLRGNVGTGPMAAFYDSAAVKSGNWPSTSLTVNATSGWETAIGELTDYSTWINYTAASWTIAANGLTITHSIATSRSAFISFPRNDKRVFGVTFTGTSPVIGIADSSLGPTTTGLTGDISNGGSAGVDSGGNYSSDGGAIIGTGVTVQTGNKYLIASDFPNALFWIKNQTTGGNWNGSGTANPDTGVGGLSFSTLATGYFWPAVSSDASGDSFLFDGNPTSGLTTFLGWDV